MSLRIWKMLPPVIVGGLMMLVSIQAWALSKDWTSKADWDTGTTKQILTNKTPGQIEIFHDPNAIPDIKTEFIYFPISNLNQVTKMVLATGKIEWHFNLDVIRTGGNPSRTSVDANGNLWVGLRNGTELVSIDPQGKLRGYAHVGSGVRSVAFDLQGFVWAGGTSGNAMYKINPNVYADPVKKIFKTEAIVKPTDLAPNYSDGTRCAANAAGCNHKPGYISPYGAVVASDGSIWVSNRFQSSVFRIDGKTNKITHGFSISGSYGIAADRVGGVWIANWDNRYVNQRDATTGALIKKWNVGDNCRGMILGPFGKMWVANSVANNQITSMDPVTGVMTKINGLGSHMIGIGADLTGSLGHIWGISYNDGHVYKVDAKTLKYTGTRYQLCGAPGTKCANTGCRFCSSPTQAQAYTYSDVTGFQLKSINTPAKGTWNVVYKPGCKGNYSNITWNGTNPTDTTTQVRIRTASTQAGLATATWGAYTDSGKALGNHAGEFVEVEFLLTTRNSKKFIPFVTDARLNYTCFPEVTNSAATTATEDSQYSFTPKVGDLDLPGDAHTWKYTKTPPGAQVNTATGAITWTPGDNDVTKTYDVTIEVCDKFNNCTTKTWKVNVKNINDLPVITSKSPTEATEDKELSYQVTASDIDPGDSISKYEIVNGPKGAKIDASGKITWTPGDDDVNAGKRSFEIKVCDANGGCVNQKFDVSVKNVNDKPSITSTAPTSGDENKEYTYAPKATDVDPGDTHKWQLVKGPKGAKIDATTGEVKWTPGDDDADKDFEFEIKVCDDGTPRLCDNQTFKVNVKNINDKPVVTGTAPVEAYVGEAISYKPKVTDADPKDTHTWSVVKGPGTINPQTGEVTWTPSQADAGKEVEFTIQVCDNGMPKLCETQTFKIPAKQKCGADSDCVGDQICFDEPLARVCVDPGCSNKTPKCKAGEFCTGATCKKDLCDGKLCAPGEICRSTDGKCVAPCAGVQCKTDEMCVDGSCVADPCATAGAACKADEMCVPDTANKGKYKCVTNPCHQQGSCKHGRVCIKGTCVTDPCDSMTCPNRTQRCVSGQCLDRQDCGNDVACPGDEICVNGKCYPQGCYAKDASCGQDQLCVDGVCKENLCEGANKKTCAQDEACRGTDGQCVRPCDGVKCPTGEQCVSGVCQKDPCDAVTCAAGKVCKEGDCVVDNCNASNTCKHGRKCNPNLSACVDDPCDSMKCPDAKQVCKWGQCVGPDSCQVDGDCPGTTLCIQGKCVRSECDSNGDCPNGKVCQNGLCLANPCDGVQCKSGEICQAGTCVASCAGVFCPTGEICVAGQCTSDPCKDKTCAQDEICVGGQCVKDTCQQDSCRGGRICVAGKCVDDPCKHVTCGAGQTCKDGQCTGDRACQTDSECPNGGVCLSNKCAPPSCYTESCKGDQLCLEGKCVDNACANKQCGEGETCRPKDGACVKNCETCVPGKMCVDGACVDDPCAGVTCNAGERCEAGSCVKDPCEEAGANLCRYQRTCQKNSCGDDSCAGVKCAEGGSCRNGQCYFAPKPEEPSTTDAGDAPEKDESTVADEENNKEADSPESKVETKPLLASGGCICSSTQGAPASGVVFFFFVLLFAITRRRK